MFIFDAHVDTLGRLLHSEEDFAADQGHLNLQKLKKSKLGAQFFAAFVHPKYYHGLALHNTLEMLDLFWQIMDLYKQDLAYAGSARDILQVQKSGGVACLLAIEGGEALEGNLANLRMLHRLGVRLLTLTWNYRNDLASGQQEGSKGGGLSRFGHDVVMEMNRIGMLIDVSHLNEPGFWDVLQESSSPVLASHSNARTLCDHPRNLTDDQIKALADGGGVIGINFYPPFLTARGQATIHDVLEHIDYLVNVGGLNCVGLGSDFDGISSTPEELEDCTKTQHLAILLTQNGYKESSIEKIMGTNLLRLCQDVLD